MTSATWLCRGVGRGSGGRPLGRHSMRRLAEKPANLRLLVRSKVGNG
jgi:hypothetical protein